MKTRGMVAVVALVLAAAGCDPGGSGAQDVEVVAGAGEADGGPAADAFIDGRLVDMVMDRAGTLRVLTEVDAVATLWTVQGGQLTHVAVPEVKADYVSQMTAGPDGAIYVALWNGEGGVWQIKPDGRAVHTLGIDRDTYSGDRVPPADGAPVKGAFLQYMHGVAVSADNRMYFAEERIRPTTFQLVRTVDAGKLKTVLGRDLTGLTERQWRSSRAGKGFPDGSPATQIALEGGLDNPIAVAPDGTVYAAPGRRTVVAVKPDGSARKVIGREGLDGDIDDPSEPFEARGSASEASVWLKGSGSVRQGTTNPSLVVDANGDLYLTSSRSFGEDLPESFDWTGDATGRQEELLVQSRDSLDGRTEETEVLRVKPDGSLSTVAGHADAVAVHDDWLYLARSFTDDEGDNRVLVVKTAIAR
ncbi:hypothetical protein [Actinoplanes friuliensis]|nr:hypothetical protein [Actinoplanes friuliensis]